MSEHRSFVVVTDKEPFSHWLAQSLQGEGTTILADHSTLDRVLQMVDLTGTRVVFVSLSRDGLRQEITFLEGLLAAKPLLSVIAVAETLDQVLLLASLRAGVRDFITPDMRTEEVINIVRRTLSRTHPASSSGVADQCWATAVISARPGNDPPMFALHLALAIQGLSPQNKTLLLDLGAPPGDTLLFLGIKSSYTFVDAVRSLRRMDATLIETAFGRHKSGLSFLAMPEDTRVQVSDITSADIYVLLGALRRFFTHIVINLGGVPTSDFLYLALGRADQIVLIAEQSLPSCKQSMDLLQQLRDNKIDLTHSGLVLDQYLQKIPPDAESVANGMGLPLLASLAPAGLARLAVMNSSQSMFDTAPKHPYAVAVRRLAQRLTTAPDAEKVPSPAWLATLRRWFGAA